MKILISGCSGFVGSHLAEYCLNKGNSVIGTIRYHHLGDEERNIEKIKDRLTLEHGDLNNYEFVHRILNKHRPDVIFHLAGQSYVQESFKSIKETIDNNVNPALNICLAILDLGLTDTVIQFACSSEEYGKVTEKECPVKETNELRPQSPYGYSKIALEYLGKMFYNVYGLKIVLTRAFNHEGPKRGKVFVISNFAKQIIDIEKGKQKPIIKVGNLDACRDWTDIRDMVAAYYLAVKKCDYGVPYNIGTGVSRSIREMLNELIKISYCSDEIKVVIDKSRLRKSEVPLLQADNKKFRDKTGWSIRYTFKETLASMLDYWRNYED